MEYRHKISLDIIGFPCKKEDISHLLEISPDAAWDAGEKKFNGDSYRKSVWILYSKSKSIDCDFAEHEKYIIDIFRGKDQLIRKIKSFSKVKLTILGEFASDYRPSIYLTSKFLDFACRNELEIDFEFSIITD